MDDERPAASRGVRRAALSIRPARADDVDAIAAVHVGAWHAAYPGLVPDGVLAAMTPSLSAARWRTRLPAAEPRHCLLATSSSGEVLGFARFGPSRDGQAAAGTGEVHALYVAPAAWGTGAGRALLTAATATLRAAGCTSATLWVLRDNERARRFYEHLGWRPDGRGRHDERDGGVLHELGYRTALRGALDEGFRLAPRTAADAEDLLAFLTRADLTLAGLLEPDVRLFLLRDARGRVLGTTGYELSADGRDALVRSVAVDAAARGRGLGVRLARAALHRAHGEGARTAWLFSRRSGPFWRRLGFEAADRDRLAVVLAGTHQVRLFARSGQLGREVAWWCRLDGPAADDLPVDDLPGI